MTTAAQPDPDLTLPLGFGEGTFRRFVAHKLDDHFEKKAAQLSSHYLQMCKAALDRDCPLLAWSFAQAAAHWRTVDRDRTTGVVLEAVLVEEPCPSIPKGYGTHPGDCACGGCPERRSA